MCSLQPQCVRCCSLSARFFRQQPAVPNWHKHRNGSLVNSFVTRKTVHPMKKALVVCLSVIAAIAVARALPSSTPTRLMHGEVISTLAHTDSSVQMARSAIHGQRLLPQNKSCDTSGNPKPPTNSLGTPGKWAQRNMWLWCMTRHISDCCGLPQKAPAVTSTNHTATAGKK